MLFVILKEKIVCSSVHNVLLLTVTRCTHVNVVSLLYSQPVAVTGRSDPFQKDFITCVSSWRKVYHKLKMWEVKLYPKMKEIDRFKINSPQSSRECWQSCTDYCIDANCKGIRLLLYWLLVCNSKEMKSHNFMRSNAWSSFCFVFSYATSCSSSGQHSSNIFVLTRVKSRSNVTCATWRSPSKVTSNVTPRSMPTSNLIRVTCAGNRSARSRH